jgi:hypothetical protein
MRWITGRDPKDCTVAVMLVLVGLALSACARVGDVGPNPTRQFHLDWHVTKHTRGVIVRGYLGNPYAVPARDIHLLVEGLDAAGGVVTRTTSAVRRIVLAGDRVPFDVLVGDAERYRVSVVAFDLVLPRAR